ncbi:RimJ/RimL family protein N-acetyltransferase [Umboniibacter marinipuniceus]|uniref:RimJ/RimL family protein N-acetyltransferase n=2 Tax=Umboniibacter marinipuniceus TaxID=569599 RepID=A0A3M0A302_9GAMM|nr:RimJ/RimL family protein N-acetyltransferase [Umboniibacter marinipuniceus]
MILASKRLSYRLFTEEDREELWALDQDPEVMRFITKGEPSSMERIETLFIPRMMAYNLPIKGWGIWRVSVSEDDRYLGWVLVRPENFFDDQRDDTSLELGWRFFQSSWGQGYATEAAAYLADQLLALNPELKQFMAIADKENEASIGVMKKLGMSFSNETSFLSPVTGCSEPVVRYVKLIPR